MSSKCYSIAFKLRAVAVMEAHSQDRFLLNVNLLNNLRVVCSIWQVRFKNN